MRTVKFNETQYRADWQRAHSGYERFAYKKFKTALDDQVKSVVNHIKAYGGISKELANMLVTKSPMETAYREVYLKVGVLHAAFTLRRINTMGKKSAPGFFSDAWNRLMSLFYTNYSASRVSDVTETTREKIQQALDDSYGMTLSEQATYLTDTLGADDFNRYRAMMIARTESTTAANYGASLGNEDADYLTAKTWIAVMDQNTRPDHVDANGQIVANTDFFIVGSSEMYYPGDISAPASEVINCRCCVAYVPLLSESGVPILK